MLNRALDPICSSAHPCVRPRSCHACVCQVPTCRVPVVCRMHGHMRVPQLISVRQHRARRAALAAWPWPRLPAHSSRHLLLISAQPCPFPRAPRYYRATDAELAPVTSGTGELDRRTDVDIKRATSSSTTSLLLNSPPVIFLSDGLILPRTTPAQATPYLNPPPSTLQL